MNLKVTHIQFETTPFNLKKTGEGGDKRIRPYNWYKYTNTNIQTIFDIIVMKVRKTTLRHQRYNVASQNKLTWDLNYHVNYDQQKLILWLLTLWWHLGKIES